MSDAPHYPGLGDGNDAPYFPPLYGMPECARCERRQTCFSREKYQRNLRDFTYTSGRCPRLPDKRGFVEQDEQKLYAAIFPLVHATRIEGSTLRLMMYLPGQKRGRRVHYHAAFKRWWIRLTDDGWTKRRFLRIENFMQTAQNILDYMGCRNSDFCIFRAELSKDWF